MALRQSSVPRGSEAFVHSSYLALRSASCALYQSILFAPASQPVSSVVASKSDAIRCEATRPLTQNLAELKRIFSERSMPGVGSALLTFLETSAKQIGYREFKLETTHSNRQGVNFYEKNGYFRIDNYGPYIGREEALCFSKALC